MTARLQRIVQKLNQFSTADWVAVVLVAAAFFLRFYNLEDSQQFLGDQGRDAIVVSRMFVEKDPVFIGPITSVGDIYLGPLYYYFMLPFLWLSYPSPMGPIYAIAFVGVLTVALMYWLGRRMAGERVALIAATMFAFSGIAVVYSRFSWNPNPAPLVSLLMVFFTWKAWRGNFHSWIAVAVCFSALIQLHYINLITAGGAASVWLLSFLQQRNNRVRLKALLKNTLLATLVMLLSFLPLFLFDLKHDWLNAQAFRNLFANEGAFAIRDFDGTGGGFGERLINTLELLFSTVGIEESFPFKRAFITVLGALTFMTLRYYAVNKNRREEWQHIVVLFAYIIPTAIGLALYQRPVHHHYVLFILPVVFLFIGTLLSFLVEFNKWLDLTIVVVFLAVFGYYNAPKMIHQDASWKIDDIRRTAEAISDRVEVGEKYNIVLIASSHDLYGQNYRYFLYTKKGKEPVNPEREIEVDALFIINEEHVPGPVTELPIYQIQIFPNKEPAEVFTIPDGPEITLLKKSD